MKSFFQQKKKVFSTDVILSLRISDQSQGKRVFDQLWQAVEAFDQRFSRFLTSSELSYLNKNAGRKVDISTELAVFLKTCVQMTRESEGLFNPLILPSLQKAGYIGSWPEVEIVDSEVDFSSRINGRIEDIEIGKTWAFLPKNYALDSGGIGKGYLLDQLSDLVAKNGVKDYWFSLGGDLICDGNNENDIGWRIGIESAKEKGSIIDYIQTNGEKVAIATSGVTKRKGVQGKTPWHHIIDPRNGQSAQSDILAATVIAKKAVWADVFAKSVVILGSAKSKDFVKKKNIEMAILQTKKDKKLIKILGVKDE